jgi:hypothetical protein
LLFFFPPLVANVLQLRNVGLFGAISWPPATNLATKNEPGVYHCPPHVFLGAVMGWLFFNTYAMTHVNFGFNWFYSKLNVR